MKIKNLIIFICLIFILIPELFAEEVEFEASNMEIKDNGNIIFAYNSNTSIPKKNIYIKSKNVKYDKKKNIIIFTGKVLFNDTEKDIIIEGDKIIYESKVQAKNILNEAKKKISEDINNKKKLISLIIAFIILIISFYSYQIYLDKKREDISNRYNSAIIEYEAANKSKIIPILKDIIDAKDATYSPLALYFIIDNELISEKNKINELFDVIIDETSLDKEIKNLNIYKKALYNADDSNESDLLNILNPVIKSESVWKSHALYLMAEYFYSKNEMQKSKEFFNQIVNLENANNEIKVESQKRLNRDLSD